MPTRTMAVRLTALLLAVSSAAAADPPDADKPPELAAFVVRVEGGAGRPAAGAEVTAYGYRHGDGGVSSFRPDGEPGWCRTTVAAGEDGSAAFEVPAAMAEKPGTKLLVYATHPDWAGRRLEAPIAAAGGEGPHATIALEAGTRLRIEPFAEAELDLSTAKLIAPRMEVIVPLGVDGETLVTHPLRADAPLVRVTATGVDGRRYESHWAAWAPRPGGEAALPLVLEPTETVRGRLSDDVPRPVRGGWVAAVYTRPADDRDYRRLGGGEATVAADGTFELTDVPPGCDVQLVALCEGHASAAPSADAQAAAVDRYPGLSPRPTAFIAEMFTPEDRADGPVVAMEPAALARVRVLQADGSPAAGVRVLANPNFYARGDGNHLVTYRPDLDDEPYEGPARSVTTDADGTAVLGPLGGRSFRVSQLTYTPPLGRWTNLEFVGDPATALAPGETGEIELTLTEPFSQ